MPAPTVTTNVVQQVEGYYVEFILSGKVVDEAGTFDEEWEADEVVNRCIDDLEG